MEVHVHTSLFSLPCPQSSLLLRFQQTIMDKIFFLSHRTMQAIEMSKESLDDESLFGSLKMDPKLSREGNMV
jgi:hypothetical protein